VTTIEAMSNVTRILGQIESGDPRAAEKLLPLVYDELRKLAAAKLAHEKPGQTLQATALVHEAYLRLVARPGDRGQESGVCQASGESNMIPDPTTLTPAFRSRGHFFAAAATAMRNILVDNARRRLAQKRGGQARREPLDAIAAPQPDDELFALDEALAKLAKEDPLKARLVELRYFLGLTADEAADVLAISPSTADRHWAYARAWLQTQVRGD
jgi:RNA polymerase sigma factor (sigma-70 family)